MRILVLSNYYPPFELGGWGQLTRDVSTCLEERGHRVHVLTSNYRRADLNSPESNVSRLLHLDSLDAAYYHPYYSLNQRRHEFENKRIISRLIADFSPDVVYVNGMWNLSQTVVFHAEQLCPGRVVYYIASTWPTDVDAHSAYWLASSANSWTRMPKRWIGNIVCNYFLSITTRKSLAFSHVLCVSGFMQRYMINEVGVPSRQTRVVHNGIDIKQFSLSSRIQLAGEPLKLLYAGGFWSIKGVDTAIEAMGILVNKLGVSGVNLTLVGSGHPDYKQGLIEKIREHGLEQIVAFGERVPRDQMPSLLQQYDVLLFPSIGPEALARIVQEAMASGLVVIGTTTGGTPEILLDGGNGLTFAARDAAMLAEKIQVLLDSVPLRQKLALAARKTVRDRFTFDRMVDELELYFEQVVNGEQF